MIAVKAVEQLEHGHIIVLPTWPMLLRFHLQRGDVMQTDIMSTAGAAA
jgi:hypothetical protein